MRFRIAALFILSAVSVLAQGTGNATYLQGRYFSSVAPSNTNVICWDSATTRWKPCAGGGGSGTVSSIATTSPITGGTITTTGTIACATCTTSAAALTSTAILKGSGLQAMAASGCTIDSSNNLTCSGTITSGSGSGVAGVVDITQGTLPGSFPVNSFSLYAPVAIATGYQWVVPAAAATGFVLGTNSAGVVTLSQVSSTGSNNVVLATSPTITTPVITTSATMNNLAIGAVSTDGFVIQNTTAAALGAQQWSPRLRFSGRGWNSAASASVTDDWIAELQPVQVTASTISAYSLTWTPLLTGSTAGQTIRFCAMSSTNTGAIIMIDQSSPCARTDIPATNGGIGPVNGNNMFALFASGERVLVHANGASLPSTGALFWTSSTLSNVNTGDTGLCRGAAGQVNVNDGSTTCATVKDLFARQVNTGPVAVSALQTCNSTNKGSRSFVTDSNAASFTAGIGAVVAQGGSTNVPVVCDGTNWLIG